MNISEEVTVVSERLRDLADVLEQMAEDGMDPYILQDVEDLVDEIGGVVFQEPTDEDLYDLGDDDGDY